MHYCIKLHIIYGSGLESPVTLCLKAVLFLASPNEVYINQ